MKIILTLLLAASLINARGQAVQDAIYSEELSNLKQHLSRVERSNARNSQQLFNAQTTIVALEANLIKANASIDTLRTELASANALIASSESALRSQIAGTASASNNQYVSIKEIISRATIYWVLAAICILSISVGLFYFLRRKLTSEKTVMLEGITLTKSSLLDQVQRTEQGLSSDIDKTRQTLRDETLKIDSKLIELLEVQMNLLKEEQKAVLPQQNEPDHSLALKVADEIVRIQKNLTNMDSDTKGLKQLSASVNRIKDNFEAKGYELVELLNKPYNEGLKLQPNFRPDESLKPGEQIITRIIKPQVNFNGVMIQAAQVEVSIGEEV